MTNPPTPLDAERQGNGERDGAVLAVAEAWASIDGKLAKFVADDGSDPLLGYRDGYLADAGALIERIERRGFTVMPLNSLPEPPQ